MLLTTEQLRKLKQTNVSKDGEKSKERIKADFSTASAEQKRSIVAVSGQSKSSLYRLYNTGTPNARIVLTLAGEFNVSPFYYTGEVDEKAPCTNALVKKFLEANGYGDIADELKGKSAAKPKRAYNKKVVEDETPETPDVADSDAEMPSFEIKSVNLEPGPKKQAASYDLTEDEAIFLLKALFIRAKADGGASSDLDAIKRLLLS